MRLPIMRLCVLLLGTALMARGADAQEKARGDRNKLTRADIEESGTAIGTAFDAVRILRSQWLSPPLGRVASSDMMGAGGGSRTIVLYIDDKRQPDMESLATVSASKVVEMKYLDQNRAVLLHGPGHEAGVIEVTTSDKRTSPN